MRLRLMSVGLALAIAGATAPAHAASFDCNKARTPDEFAICGNPSLSLLDTEMGALWFSYSRIPMMMGSNGARHDDAQQFLKDRGQCGRNVACLTSLYTRRNADLRKGIVDALGRLTLE